MNFAFIVQRYGKEVIGGAESHARQVAEQLVSRGDQVTIYTTSALSYQNWKPHYAAGNETLNGVIVKRFAVERTRRPLLFRLANQTLPRLTQAPLGKPLRDALQDLWYRLQGPYTPSLLRAVQSDAKKYDAWVCFTYLYYPTVYGLPLLPSAAIVPTAHDEPALYLPRTRDLLLRADRLLVNGPTESRLLQRLDPQLSAKCEITGVGVESPEPIKAQTERAPYLLFLGRIGRGKNSHLLAKDFLSWKQMHPESNLKLWLIGELEPDAGIPKHADVIVRGPADEAEKWRLIASATAVVNPSAHESLSLLCLEAMVCETPLLLNSACEVFRDYAAIGRSVQLYEASATFVTALDALLNEPLAPNDLQDARRWVQERYTWDRVCARYRALATR